MKRPTHKQKVLDLLSDGRWHSHHEGYALHVMFHSRVADLRSDGYVIERTQKKGTYWYQLKGCIEASERSDGLTLRRGSDASIEPSDAGAAAVALEGSTQQLALTGAAFRKREAA